MRFRLLFDRRATATAELVGCRPAAAAAAERSDRVSDGDSGGGTRTPLRWAVWTRRPDCVNLGRYRVRIQKRMYNDGNDDNNNNISFVCLSFRMLFVFLSIFLVFLFYPVHAQQTRAYDRAPDGMLESARLYLYDIFVSFFFLRFYFSVLIFFFDHKRGHSA